MHLHLPRRVTVPFVLLVVVHASAIAVALAHPGRPTLAGLVVVAGLTARWVAHHRRFPAPTSAAVLTADAAPAPAPAAAA